MSSRLTGSYTPQPPLFTHESEIDGLVATISSTITTNDYRLTENNGMDGANDKDVVATGVCWTRRYLGGETIRDEQYYQR